MTDDTTALSSARHQTQHQDVTWVLSFNLHSKLWRLDGETESWHGGVLRI